MCLGSETMLNGNQGKYAHEVHGESGFGRIYDHANAFPDVEDISQGWEDLYQPPLTRSKLEDYHDASNLFVRSYKPAHEELVDLVKLLPPKSITVITIGPLTNLALAIQHNRDVILSRVRRVVSMAGAIDAPGNVTPVAEFNVWSDPEAMQVVLDATKQNNSTNHPGLDVHLVPVDGTCFCQFIQLFTWL